MDFDVQSTVDAKFKRWSGSVKGVLEMHPRQRKSTYFHCDGVYYDTEYPTATTCLQNDSLMYEGGTVTLCHKSQSRAAATKNHFGVPLIVHRNSVCARSYTQCRRYT